jgi:hypothetical protein
MRQGPHQSAQKSTSTGTGTLWITSSNKISSTAKGSESGGNSDLQFPQRPVLDKYFAGIRFFWPQWLHARITGKKALHHTNRCHSLLLGAFSEVYISKSKIRKAPSHSFVAGCLVSGSMMVKLRASARLRPPAIAGKRASASSLSGSSICGSGTLSSRMLEPYINVRRFKCLSFGDPSACTQAATAFGIVF